MSDETVNPSPQDAAEETLGGTATPADPTPTAAEPAVEGEATAAAPVAESDEPAQVVEAAEAVDAAEPSEPAQVSTVAADVAPVAAASEDAAPVAAEAPAETGTRAAAVVEVPASEQGMMEDTVTQAGAYANNIPSLSEGDVVQGVVVHIDRGGEVLVDVGTKSEGIIRRNELSRDTSTPADELVKVGDTIDVYVIGTETDDGSLLLSKKRADFEKAWDRVQEAKDEQRTITAMVTDRVKGGLVVDLGIRGFVPASHVGNGSLKTNLERYVGQSIPLKVIEVDKERRKVVLSNKLAQEEERQSRKAETIANLQPGKVQRGVVRRLTNYGAFVDLGGIDGLLHISEMSWTRINHPSEVLREGQEIDVLILKMDLDANRVSLGLRQILPDPWTGIDARYHVGEVIQGQITRVVPFGAFVQVEGGIEGIIPNSELAGRRGGKGGPPLAQGQDIEVRIIDLRPDERKMTLSLRQARQEEEVRRERRDVDDYHARPDRSEPRFTIGDALRAKEREEEDEE